MSILMQINKYYDIATKSEKKIIDDIRSNPQNVIGYTSKELANKLAISNSTITRFSQKLGYKGYIEFSKALFEEHRTAPANTAHINPSQKLNRVMQSLDGINNKLYNILNSDIINLTKTFETFDPDNLQNIVQEFERCDKIYIVGFSSCKIIADFIHFHLSRVGFNTESITSGGTELFDRLGRPNQKQCIFLITFPKYSKDSKNVTKISQFLKAPLIVMTDKENAFTKHAVHKILVQTDNNYTFYNSMVAPMAVVNALIASCAIQNPTKTNEYITFNLKKTKLTASIIDK